MCFSSPLSKAYIENPFKQRVVSHPFPERNKVSNNVRARVTLMGATARPLLLQLSSPTGFGQQEQWQSRTIRAKTSTDCVTAPTAFHIYIGKNKSTVFLQQDICLSSLRT